VKILQKVLEGYFLTHTVVDFNFELMLQCDL